MEKYIFRENDGWIMLMIKKYIAAHARFFVRNSSVRSRTDLRFKIDRYRCFIVPLGGTENVNILSSPNELLPQSSISSREIDNLDDRDNVASLRGIRNLHVFA